MRAEAHPPAFWLVYGLATRRQMPSGWFSQSSILSIPSSILFSGPSLSFFSALWTYPNEFQPTSDDFVIGYLTESILNGSEWFHRDIFNTVAPYAANVIVVFCIAIEPFLSTNQLQFPNHAVFG
jgi:hypothetical protein